MLYTVVNIFKVTTDLTPSWAAVVIGALYGP